MRRSTLRLADCGDFLTLAEYCQWRGESETTVRRQVKAGTCFVQPCQEKPHLRWRTSDCERAMAKANIVIERQRRAKAALQAVS